MNWPHVRNTCGRVITLDFASEMTVRHVRATTYTGLGRIALSAASRTLCLTGSTATDSADHDGLEVVPNACADLLLGVIVELVLTRIAVKVKGANSHYLASPPP